MGDESNSLRLIEIFTLLSFLPEREEDLEPEFLIFPIFSNICYQNVDFRVTNGDENRFIMA